MINLHFGTSNSLHKEKKTFHKQYLCGLLFSGNKKKTYTGQSILQVFFLYLKRNNSQTFELQRDTNCFGNVFIPCDNWRTSLS